MPKISGSEIKSFFNAGGKYVADVALKIHGEKLTEIGEEAFAEAIEIGISNTIAALYDANVKDKEIIRVLNKYWGINIEEAEKRIVFEKIQSTIRELKHYLKLQGLSEMKVNEFMKSNRVFAKIRNNPELWVLRNKPEVLYKEVQKSNI